jgi:hypothetical protein
MRRRRAARDVGAEKMHSLVSAESICMREKAVGPWLDSLNSSLILIYFF